MALIIALNNLSSKEGEIIMYPASLSQVDKIYHKIKHNRTPKIWQIMILIARECCNHSIVNKKFILNRLIIFKIASLEIILYIIKKTIAIM